MNIIPTFYTQYAILFEFAGNLSFYYQNCGGIRTKLNTIYMNILSYSYDIIVLTETWLIPSIADSEFIDGRYIVFRCDRDRAATGREEGGGVLVAVRRELRPVRRALPGPVPPIVDCVSVEIPSASRGKQCIVNAVYIPPNQCSNTYVVYLDLVCDLVLCDNVTEHFVIGDFNLPSLEWGVNNGLCLPFIRNDTVYAGKYLVQILSLLNATQHNIYKNNLNRTLDLFISNTDCTCLTPTSPLSPLVQHHPCFYILSKITTALISIPRQPRIKLCFAKADYININEAINKANWCDILIGSINEIINIFYEKLFSIIKLFTPVSVIKNSNSPCWFTPSLRRIFKAKAKAWVKWKKYKNIVDYELFSMYRRRFDMESRKCFDNYISFTEQSLTKNIKSFWNYMSCLKIKPGIPTTMTYMGNSSSDPEMICKMFAHFFQSVYEPSTLNIETWESSVGDTNSSNNNICSLYFSENDVYKVLRALDSNKGAGPDSLPPSFIKLTAGALCVPLKIIYNKCMQEGIFPDLWKTAHITPVFKSGDRDNIENYRPISILSTLAKVFERLVHAQLYPLVHNDILQEQHGFVQQKSTTTNLLLYATYLFESMDNGVQVDAVYTDFRKAFDKVDHEILLKKLAFNGVRGNLLRWFASYIINRSQRVVVRGFESDTFITSSGVPQGSILGPLLFIIFINDINQCFKHCKFLLYADDLKLYLSVRDLSDCHDLQSDLNRLSEYCVLNKLRFNLTKCNTITITKNKNIIKQQYFLNGTQLNRVNHVRDLGIIIDSRLHLDQHVNNIVNNAFKMYGFVMRSTKDFKKPSTLIYLYTSLIRPQLEYALQIWNPIYNKYVDQIENVQRRYLRSLHYKFSHSYLSYSELLDKYKLMSLASRRKLLSTMSLYNICNSNINCPQLLSNIDFLVPNRVSLRNTRTPRLFKLKKCRTTAGKRAPLYQMTQTYNAEFYNTDIFGLTIGAYKKRIKAITEKVNNNNC